eukprot:scaffold123338_cov21-Prasinocladus_malaysianus.AAC.1
MKAASCCPFRQVALHMLLNTEPLGAVTLEMTASFRQGTALLSLPGTAGQLDLTTSFGSGSTVTLAFDPTNWGGASQVLLQVSPTEPST